MNFAPYDPRTILGIQQGFGWCRKCGGTWNWKTGFEIPTGPSCSTFPICTDCADSMSVDDIMGHLRALVESRDPIPEALPDGRPIPPRPPEDLVLAEWWVKAWKEDHEPGEDPEDLRHKQGPIKGA